MISNLVCSLVASLGTLNKDRHIPLVCLVQSLKAVLPLLVVVAGAAAVDASAGVGAAEPVRVDYYMESLCP